MNAETTAPIALEKVDCPVCGGHCLTHIFSRKDQYGTDGRQWDVCACTCGVQMVSPRPRSDEMHRFYPAFYTVPQRSPGVLSALEQGYRNDLLQWEARVFSRCSKLTQGDVLDVGCGSGDRLDVLTQKGYIAVGIEPFRSKWNARIPYKSIEEAVASKKCYDAVLFNNSFEHLHDPCGVIVACRRLLKPEGCLAIVIPNRGSLQARLFGKHWAAYDLPRDLYFYSANELDRLVVGAGFERITRITANPVLHPPTIVLSLFPMLDPRMNFKDRRGWKTMVRAIVWVCATILFSPVAWIESCLGLGSMMYAFYRKINE